ncbi:hypothetical protein PFLUV_G00201010 [Perca fluviatilis]|uniref:Uncharacterized protein n=1 Tax=Perca fluviatilis TaxID=8168 RepID=A0A6A5DTP1_PERFL|nr:hypothetical protein PFLUV_G00201010 [Perca fluviatilis]
MEKERPEGDALPQHGREGVGVATTGTGARRRERTGTRLVRRQTGRWTKGMLRTRYESESLKNRRQAHRGIPSDCYHFFCSVGRTV